MKKVLPIFLGILTAIGGFVDMGDLVANAAVGARFGMSLAWVVVVGVVGICVFADMSGRVAAVTGRAVFDLVRERLGPRAAAINLAASFFINVLTLIAEICGVAIALSLLSSINYLVLVPAGAVLVWVVVWRLPFSWMEQIFGLLGLALVVFAVAVVIRASTSPRSRSLSWSGGWMEPNVPLRPSSDPSCSDTTIAV